MIKITFRLSHKTSGKTTEPLSSMTEVNCHGFTKTGPVYQVHLNNRNLPWVNTDEQGYDSTIQGPLVSPTLQQL